MGVRGLTAAVVLVALMSFIATAAYRLPCPQLRIVGGSAHWRFGFNYSDWAIKNSPFYVLDTLVFKYDPPSNTTFPHNVYLLKSAADFESCNFKNAILLANATQGGGSGFKYILKEVSKRYYFACGVHDGYHCSKGMMKFSVAPIVPSYD